MASLKERLAATPDLLTRCVKVADGKLECTIRRLTMRERDEYAAKYKNVKDAVVDQQQASDGVKALIALALVEPPTTAEDLADLPASVIEELAKAIVDFNGWTREGRAALADQFRAPA